MIKEIPKDLKILIYTNPSILGFLNLLSEKNIVTMDRFIQLNVVNFYVHATSFVYFPFMSPNCLVDANHWYTSELMDLVRDTYTYPEMNQPKDLIIIMDRMDASSRVLNSSTYLEWNLELKYPNEKFVYWNAKRDQKNLKDTIQLFQRAKLVISPHGAQFLNIMWCSKGTSIIEIGFFDNQYPLPSTYYALSISLGHNYYLVIGNGGLSAKYIYLEKYKIYQYIDIVLNK
jgi:hypothetical protein